MQTTERHLDSVLDSLYELNTETPKLKISRETPPKPSLIFGLLSESGSESKVFDMLNEENEDRKRLGFIGDGADNGSGHADSETGEVQTVNIWKGGKQPGHKHEHEHEHKQTHAKDQETGQPIQISQEGEPLTKERLDELLSKLPSEDVWRVKGFLKIANGSNSTASSSYHILNWAFGRYELHPASERMTQQLQDQDVEIRLTVMGARGEAKRRSRLLAEKLQAEIS